MNILDYTGTKFINSPIDLPTIGGNSGEIGKTGVVVNIYIGIKLFTVPVDPKTGLFTWTATEAFPDGDYSVSISTVDRAGNVGTPTLRTLRIDTTPPEAPELLNLYDDQGGKQSSFDPGQTTDDKRPKLTGIAQAGTLVYLRDADGNTIGSARADKVTGKWEMEPVQDLRDGDNNLTLVAEETFGGVTREGAPSASFKIVIGADSGILPPDTITITQAIDDAGSATGVLSNGALTDDTTPTLNGVVSAGSTVTVYYRLAGSNIWAGSATATVTGESWSWTPGSALATGNYEFQASNGANSSALFSLEIATAEQIALRTNIDSAYDDFGQDQGPLANGAITDDATPGLRGRAEANSTVIVRYMLEGGSAASVTVNADSAGNWKWTPAADLQIGNWEFDVQAQGRSTWSSKFKLQITGTGENSFAPVIDYAFDDVGTSTGERKSGATIDDTTPTLHGKAAANSVVYLQAINGAEVQTFSVQADSSSKWEWTPPTELAQGDWKFQVSKGAGEGFGDAFELNIGKSGNFSGYLDFETPSTGYFEGGVLTLDPVQISEHATLRVISTANGWVGDKTASIISTNGSGEAELGSNALVIGGNQIFEFQFSNADFNSHLVTNFSAQIYNPDVKNLTIKLIATALGQPNQWVSITFKPGITTITEATIAPHLPKNSLITGVSIDTSAGLLGRTDKLLIDNVNWTTKEDNQTSSLFSEDVSDDGHAISSIEELTDTTVIGNENQMDILQLTGKDQILDLTTVSNRIESIEIFDITGSGDNTLKLDLTALLQHGEKDLFIEDGKTQLVVNGNEGDVVQLVDILPEGSDISAWQHQEGTVTVAGVEYNVYSHGDDAELLVQQGVKTELV